MKILNFGSLNIDHVYGVDHFVRAGETLSSLDYSIHVGGKGLNQSIATARAGGQVYHAGCIGADGAFLADYLAQSGVDTSLVEVVDVPTGHAIIQVDVRGGNCILLYPGANRAVRSERIREVLDQFGPEDMLLLQNEINNIGEIIAQAKARGMTVALNPSPISPELLSMDLSGVDWFILNEIEGAAIANESEPDKILQALTLRYPAAHILLTLGSEGSQYAHGAERMCQAAFRVEAVDTTAAGDTFTGYFLATYAATRDARHSLETAAKASAITVTRPGAAETIPQRAQVDAWNP